MRRAERCRDCYMKEVRKPVLEIRLCEACGVQMQVRRRGSRRFCSAECRRLKEEGHKSWAQKDLRLFKGKKAKDYLVQPTDPVIPED